jgi:hypothetical protein
MMMKRIIQCLLIAMTALTASLPAQAAMVGTGQMQANPAVIGDMAQQRDWIRQQLVKGGVDESTAVTRVAAMTDVQVSEINRRIDEMPAGASGEALIIIGLVLVITELMGYTDIIPNWPAE